MHCSGKFLISGTFFSFFSRKLRQHNKIFISACKQTNREPHIQCSPHDVLNNDVTSPKSTRLGNKESQTNTGTNQRSDPWWFLGRCHQLITYSISLVVWSTSLEGPENASSNAKLKSTRVTLSSTTLPFHCYILTKDEVINVCLLKVCSSTFLLHNHKSSTINYSEPQYT